MKKELIVFIPSLQIGGVEKNFFILTNNLSKRLNISVITSTSKIKNNLNRNIKLICPNISFIEKLSMRLRFLICLYYLFKKIFLNPKAIVISFQGNMYSVFLCKLLRVKIILRLNSSPIGWSKNLFKKFIYIIGLKLADGVIVNSKKFKYQIRKEFNINSQCIYNPLNFEEIIRLSKKKLSFKFFKKKNLNIINVARLDDQKNQLLLLKSIKNLKEKLKIRLLIIGNGPNEKLLKDFIKLNKLNKIVMIKKNIKNPFPYILRSNLFILSSSFEGLPNVLLEAIVLNKFIISSNCPTGPSEILSNGKGGILFKVNDHHDLTTKIIFFYKNKVPLKKKIFFAKKNLKRFDMEKNINNYFKFIKRYY